MDDQTRDDLVDEVRVAIATLTSPWTLAQLAAAVGSRVDDVRPCVERMIEGGTIENLGKDPRGDDEGPVLYGPRPFEERPN